MRWPSMQRCPDRRGHCPAPDGRPAPTPGLRPAPRAHVSHRCHLCLIRDPRVWGLGQLPHRLNRLDKRDPTILWVRDRTFCPVVAQRAVDDRSSAPRGHPGAQVPSLCCCYPLGRRLWQKLSPASRLPSGPQEGGDREGRLTGPLSSSHWPYLAARDAGKCHL